MDYRQKFDDDFRELSIFGQRGRFSHPVIITSFAKQLSQFGAHREYI